MAKMGLKNRIFDKNREKRKKNDVRAGFWACPAAIIC